MITEKKVISRMVNYLENLFDDNVSTIEAELNLWDSIKYGKTDE